jgi:hypothetical protein
MLADPAVKRHFGDGTSLMVATADGDGVPSCCRAVGLAGDADGDSLTVYLPVWTAAQTIANLAATHRIAIVSSFPLDHGTIQLKGRSGAVRVARDDERPLVDRWLGRFADVVSSLGLPRAVAMSLVHWPAFAVDVEVDAIFDQTPGPRAGSVVRQR